VKARRIGRNPQAKARRFRPNLAADLLRSANVAGSGSLIASSLRMYQREAAGIIVFDTWLMNTDRGSGDNLLVYPDSSDGLNFRFAMIDHGHILNGPSWDSFLLDPDSVVTLSDYHPDMVPASLVRGDFAPYLDRLEAITDSTIEDAIAAIPSDWQCPPEDRETLRRFLMNRRSLVRSAVYAAYP